jgi:UDP-glucose 4-epimerase
LKLLVTGGTGFVMSHVIRQWVERGDSYSAICVDVFPPDDVLRKFFAPVSNQIQMIEGSVTDASFWEGPAGDLTPDYFVHGAAMTPNRGASEKSEARTVVEVNIQGVLNALEWARNCSSLKRTIHVSTGSVYGEEGPEGPLPESGYEMQSPDSLYPITKRAGELLAMRYRELFEMSLAVCRLSSIYGPMDRWTPGRDFNCLPHRIVHSALQGESIKVSGADAIGDWLHAADVASGILTLIEAPSLEHHLFNISSGEAASIRELIEAVAKKVPEMNWDEVEPRLADIVGDTSHKFGSWGAYDNSRLRALGWSPMPLDLALADYVDWVRQEL